jgi:hypothetical protein
MWLMAAAPAASAVDSGDPGPISDAARALARSVLDAADHGHGPFAIVDKPAATLLVYGADGTLIGRSPVLLGRAAGDRSAPGVGDRAQQRHLSADDRSTPAGRFVSEPGHNLAGDAVIWVDYAAAFAIHRLRPGAALAARTQGLASAKVQDRRLSDGCVVVPAAFYAAVVWPLLSAGRSVVYVMPEAQPWQSLWPTLASRNP